ncbi:MAG: hydroxyacylglutathione hydrolase [Bradymonadia bacterium]|jgi:hydroxyacylglutathione hydrolase
MNESMRVIPVASTISDNFMYLVVEDDHCLLIDPVDAEVAVEAARATGATKFQVFTTHGHPDHAGGNAAVKETLGCEVLGSVVETGFDWKYDRLLEDEERIPIGSSHGIVVHLPGHTHGHVALLAGMEHIISGDVIFVGGAGNCRFGGDPSELYETFRDQLPKGADDAMFYPGHDYSKRNWEFCLSVEPQNEEAARLLAEHASHTREDGPILHTLGQERSYNPFFRVEDETFQAYLFERYPDLEADVQNPGERAFRLLRSLRDQF